MTIFTIDMEPPASISISGKFGNETGSNGVLRMYCKLVTALVVTFVIFIGSCTVCDIINVTDLFIATGITVLLWSLVAAVCIKIKADLTSPGFLTYCLGPNLIFILYLILWICICKCCNHAADIKFHLMTIKALEIILILSIIAILSQWLHGRSVHLTYCTYSDVLLFCCLVLLYSLILNLVLFTRSRR